MVVYRNCEGRIQPENLQLDAPLRFVNYRPPPDFVAGRRASLATFACLTEPLEAGVWRVRPIVRSHRTLPQAWTSYVTALALGRSHYLPAATQKPATSNRYIGELCGGRTPAQAQTVYSYSAHERPPGPVFHSSILYSSPTFLPPRASSPVIRRSAPPCAATRH